MVGCGLLCLVCLVFGRACAVDAGVAAVLLVRGDVYG